MNRSNEYIPRRHTVDYFRTGVKDAWAMFAYWLYAAVEPTTGEAFWWELPCLYADRSIR